MDNARLFLVLFIGVLLGAGVVFLFSSRAPSTARGDLPAAAPNTSIADVAARPSAEFSGARLPASPAIPKNVRIGLSVADQPAGKTVAVSGLEIKEKQWVAIYDDRDGRPGWILGATRVHTGDTDAIVEVLRPGGTLSGMTYYAALLNDDGDDEFNRLTDLPPLSPERVVIVSFIAQ